jgi:hypothetical protein
LIITSRFINRLTTIFPKILWGTSILNAGLLYFAVSISNFAIFNIVIAFLGLSLGGIMATLLINSQNAINDEDRTVLSGIVQLSRYLGAAVGVMVLTGILPEVGQISVATQFLGAFSLLIGIYALGLVNELI